MFACTVKDASDRKLIPFLTEDDALYCFDAAGPIIYIIDLAEEDGKAKPTKYENFLDLVNDIREDYGLPPWLPSEK